MDTKRIGHGEVIVFPDSVALAHEAARRFILLAQEAIANRGCFNVALAGGTTPKALYQLLATARPPTIRWDETYLFWGDERFVPPDDSDSTYAMVNEVLLKPIGIAARNVFQVPTTDCSLEEAAARYGDLLRAHTRAALPRLDLVVLGMGPDGHTASLFPGSDTLNSQELVAAERNSPKPPAERITMTLRLINNAANIIFLIAGADKANTLRLVLEHVGEVERLPASRVNPQDGTLVWLVDHAAASELRQ
jgi:6-phosphogluconolactonase